MPNVVDSVGAFLTIVQSGVVVSGNNFITVTRQLTSGDAINLFKVSGNTDLITLQLLRNQPKAMTGGVFTQVADEIAAELFIHYQNKSVSGAYPSFSGAGWTVQTRVQDFKITIASGAFNSGYNLSRPILVSEASPVMHETFAKTRLIYRTRYLL